MQEIKKRPIWFIIFKIIFIQVFSNYVAKYSVLGYETHLAIAGSILILANWFLVRDMIDFVPYFSMIVLFCVVGIIHMSISIHYKLVAFAGPLPPIWVLVLWFMFFGYYGDVLNKMLDFPLWLNGILGAIGGYLAHVRGLTLANVEAYGNFYYYVAGMWFFFMPASLRLFRYFKNKKLKLA
jgi:hypothetical protein